MPSRLLLDSDETDDVADEDEDDVTDEDDASDETDDVEEDELEDDASSAKPSVGADARSIAPAAIAARDRFIRRRGRKEKDDFTLSGRAERWIAWYDF